MNTSYDFSYTKRASQKLLKPTSKRNWPCPRLHNYIPTCISPAELEFPAQRSVRYIRSLAGLPCIDLVF